MPIVILESMIGSGFVSGSNSTESSEFIPEKV